MRFQWIIVSALSLFTCYWAGSGQPDTSRVSRVGNTQSELETKEELRAEKTAPAKQVVVADSFVQPAQYAVPDEMNPTRTIVGVDQSFGRRAEPKWSDARAVPWEVLGAGEFLGPIRRPYESDYRVRINDLLELTFATSRRMTSTPYRIQLGDELEINDTNRPEISKQKQIVMDDGFISPLEIEQVHVAGKTIEQVNRILNKAYLKAGTRDPTITVSITKNNTALTDLLNAVQGQFNANGSIKQVRVSPDGTIQLPIIGRVCVYGLTMDEVGREVDLRYSKYFYNLNVTPALVELAPKSVFVFGEVAQPGVVQLNGPTTAMGAIAAAQGFLQGANRRQVVVLRRDSEWRMVATKLDLAGAALGKSPIPSDDVWLRPSDIVIVPKQPIQRLAEFIDLYFTRTLFVLVPNQGISFNFDESGNLN